MAKKKAGGTRRRRPSNDFMLFAMDRPTESGQLFGEPSGTACVMDDPVGSVLIIDPDLVDPCPVCDGLNFWWDYKDVRFCRTCDPPNRDSREVITLRDQLAAKVKPRRKKKQV